MRRFLWPLIVFAVLLPMTFVGTGVSVVSAAPVIIAPVDVSPVSDYSGVGVYVPMFQPAPEPEKAPVAPEPTLADKLRERPRADDIVVDWKLPSSDDPPRYYTPTAQRLRPGLYNMPLGTLVVYRPKLVKR